MTTHELKLNIEFCEPVLRGEKTFELRKNDRGFQKGDHIFFVPVENCLFGTRETDHPIRSKEYEITYVIGGWGLQDGYVALAIKDCTEENPLPY